MWQLRLNTENPAYQAPLDAIKYKYNCKVANGSKSVLRHSEVGQEVCWRKGYIIAVTCLHGYQHHQHALLAASVIYQIVRHVQPQILSSSKEA